MRQHTLNTGQLANHLVIEPKSLRAVMLMVIDFKAGLTRNSIVRHATETLS